MRLAPHEEVDRLSERSAARIGDAVEEVVRAVVDRRVHFETPAVALGRVLAATQAQADLLARRRVLLLTDHLRDGAPAPAFDAGTPLVPDVAPEEAIENLVAREPRLAASAAEVARLYDEGHAFALARSSSRIVTDRVQGALARALQRGDAEPESVERVAELGDFSRSYARTVFRTNLSTAYSAGVFRMTQEEGVRDVVAALEFAGPDDGDKRDNHRAALGVVGAPHDPVWHQLAPPLGFNCRDGLDLVIWADAKERGLLDADGRVRPASVPAGAGPDEGFRHVFRPDVAIALRS